jgi:hypothetical protein
MLSIALQSYPQKKRLGYIILPSGDSLKGKIKIPGIFNGTREYTLYNESEVPRKFTENEIIGFGYVKDDTQFDYMKFKLSRTLFGKDLFGFAKNIVRGKISAYQYDWNNGKTGGTEIFLVTTQDEIYLLDLTDFTNKKNILKTVFADCHEAVEKVKGIVDVEKIVKWVNNYNACGS